MTDDESAPNRTANPIRRARRMSDTSGDRPPTPRETTAGRWRLLSEELAAWAAVMAAEPHREVEAREQIGALCCREALAQRACSPL